MRFLRITLTAVFVVAVFLPAGIAQQERPRNRQRRRQPPKPLTVEQVRKTLPDSVKYVPDLAYREGNPAWRLDLAAPAVPSAEPRPAIVIVHGGGWVGGDKRVGQWARLPVEYASEGYVAISVNYRLVTEAAMPACIEDVKCAIRWLRAHAAEYNIDPGRIGAYGNSAGAHLVAAVGLAGPDAGLEGDGPYQEFSSGLQAVCASATPTDFVHIREDLDREPAARPGAMRGVPDEKLESIKTLASPVTHVRADAPPFLLFHGNADRTVSVKQTERLVKALRAAGAENVTYFMVDGEGHGAMTRKASITFPAMQAFFDATIGKRAKK